MIRRPSHFDARLIDDCARETSQAPAYLYLSRVILPGPPFSMAAWFRWTAGASSTKGIIGVGDASASTGTAWLGVRLPPNDTLRLTMIGDGGTTRTVTSTRLSVGNRWHLGVGIVVSATAAALALDNEVTVSGFGTFGTMANLDRATVGERPESGFGVPFPGLIQWPCIWNIVLSRGEIAALNAGVPPWRIRPGNIVGLPELRTLMDARWNVPWTNVSSKPAPPFIRVPEFTHGGLGYPVVSCGDQTLGSEQGFADNFTRSNSSSLGSDWTEFGEAGTGIEIHSNALACRIPGAVTTFPRGYALATKAIDFNSLAIRWNAQSGKGNSTVVFMEVIARNNLPGALGLQYYRLQLNSVTGGANLYRAGLLLGAVATQIYSACHAYEWRITNLPGLVRHQIYRSGFLETTIDDTSPSRLTSGAYHGVRLSVDNVPVGVGETLDVYVGSFAVDPLSFSGAALGAHSFTTSFSGDATGVFHLAEATTFEGFAAGSHAVVQAFEGSALGEHTLVQSFSGAALGEFSYYGQFSGAASGVYHHPSTFAGFAAGEHRVANDSLSRYEVFKGENQQPDFTASAWVTSASLPIVTDVLTFGVTTYLVTRKRNAYNLSSQNIEAWSIELDGSGVQVAVAPSNPLVMTIEPAAAGAVRVQASYVYDADGADQADTWAVWLTTNGVDPNPAVDPPAATAAMRFADGYSKLDWTSGTFADGLTAKTIVRTRRTGTPNVDSRNTAIVSTTTDTDGPSQIANPQALFGSVQGHQV